MPILSGTSSDMLSSPEGATSFGGIMPPLQGSQCEQERVVRGRKGAALPWRDGALFRANPQNME